MPYHVDLTNITIDDYKLILKTMHLLPSWMLLAEDTDKHFEALKTNGISNLDELLTALKDKKKLGAFAERSGISTDYLTVLRRVVNGYKQKPSRLRDFPFIADAVVQKLEALKLNNTLKLYARVLTGELRHELAVESGVSEEELIKLAKLCDLSRVRWVNHNFAYVLYEAGIDSVTKVAQSTAEEVYHAVVKVNEEQQIYKAHIGLNDMWFCIESARMLDAELECD